MNTATSRSVSGRAGTKSGGRFWRTSLPASRACFGDFEQDVDIVFLTKLVLLRLATFRAFVVDDNLLALQLVGNRKHQAPTRRASVTGIDVDMLAYQAAWTMIGVATADNRVAAVFAGEVFDRLLEFFHA